MARESATHVNDRQRAHWDAAADGWATWLDWTERNFQPLTTWLQEMVARPAHGRILDVACGAGYPALAIAKWVRPWGLVVATDISQRMIALASDRAREKRLGNIEFEQMDAEALRFQDGSFAFVINAYGLMFCADPRRALSEARRVLAPGARIAVATWDEPSRNPFFSVGRDVAAVFLGLAEPRPDSPGAFRLSSPDVLVSLLQSAGFPRVRVDRIPMTFECESALEYCRILTDFAWKSKVAALSPSEVERFTEAVAAAARPYADGERVRLVATSLLASGDK